MSTKLRFAKSSLLDTAVFTGTIPKTDSETIDHPPLYEIVTERSWVQRTTFVRKLDLVRPREENLPHTNEEIARIHWNMIGPEVIFQGRRIPMSTFVEKVSSAEESYTVHAQGEQYKWSRDGDNSVKLVKVKLDGEETHIANLKSDIEGSFLEVVPDCSMIHDHILVSFLFINEKWFRGRNRSPDPTQRAS